MTEINESFDYIRINLASPQRIKDWARHSLRPDINISEVQKTDTLNYRTYKPEIGGLFCERIFGPVKSWECACGNHKAVRQVGIICEICDVEITESRVRRHRMGYIELGKPVTHIWYARGFPSYICLILNIRRRRLYDIIYFNRIDYSNNKDGFLSLLSSVYGNQRPKFGAELIFDLLKRLDLARTVEQCRALYTITPPEKHKRLIRRIRVLENFIATNSHPTWMLLTVLPVLPPGLRPIIELDGGKIAASDLNELYKRVIYRNNRLKRFLKMHSSEIVVKNEKRMLQEAVDALIDNGKREKQSVSSLNNRELKSLSDIISGKEGRFRQNLLGKRVDYSGRSVIVVGPTLKLNQCGLPYEMCCELFQPFIVKLLLKYKYAGNIKSANDLLHKKDIRVWNIVKCVIKGFPIFLNRAPTLHRIGIQAFEPIIATGRAIQLHPLVCTAFNADFDGDQMAVHIPLSTMTQTESYLLMLSPNNFISPATGEPIVVPSQDMVLGANYLTSQNQIRLFGNHTYFSDVDDILIAYHSNKIKLHASIWLRFDGNVETSEKAELIKKIELADQSTVEIYKDRQIRYDFKRNIIAQYILTTPGRVLFNQLIYSI